MGTTARIRIFDEHNSLLVNIMKNYDGSDVFNNLFNFIKGKKLVKSIPLDSTFVFNGMGDFAAQYIAHIKKGAGDVYIQSMHSVYKCDFNVSVRQKDGKIVVENG